MFEIGDTVYDQSEGADHTVIRIITDKYYEEGYDIAIIELDNDYTVSAECIALAYEE